MSTGQEKTEESLKAQAVRWLFGQEANTVALYLILAALGAGAWYGVPLIWKTQNEFYKEMDERHERARAVDRETYKDALDRIERRSATALTPRESHGFAKASPAE